MQLHKRLPKEMVEEVLEQFNKGVLSEEKAKEFLGIGRSRLYELRRRWLRCELRGEEFKLYGRERSDFHRYPEGEAEFLREELGYIRDEAEIYKGKFNFSFLAEEAEKGFRHRFHRDSIRRFAIREGYYQMLPQQKGKVYVRFEMSKIGALYQHDTSTHLWIPSMGRNSDLIMTEDDYSRMVVGSKLVDKETSFAHLQVARETIKDYGIPLAYYVDNHKIFRFVEHKGIHVEYKLGADEVDPQFKAALKELEIGVIYASKPESKGKIEKRFDYFQRRMPFLCEKYKVKDVGEESDKILDDLIGYYNESHIHAETKEIPSKRWERAKREGKVALREIEDEIDWDYIFSLRYQRKIKKDGSISFKGKRYMIGRYPKSYVTVCLIPEEKLMVYKGKEKIGNFRL